jgi:NADH:ubiquinone oxidoreductase subunit E
MSTYDVQPILDRYPTDEKSVIEILHDIQTQFKHVPVESLALVSDHTGVSLAKVAGVATFYKTFTFQPKGDKVVRVCMGTACHVKGAAQILEECERTIGVPSGGTTEDGKYTLEHVNCVGACAMAPLVIVNEEYLGQFRPIDVKSLVGEVDKP